MADAPPDPLAVWARHDPAASAVVENGTAITRVELNERVNRLASGLAALGVRPGERAVWSGPNSTEVLVVIHACRKLGVVSVPMPYRLTPAECRHIVGHSGAAVVLVDAGHASAVAGVLSGLTAVRHALSFRGHVTGMRSIDDVIAMGSSDEPVVPADAGRVMFYTSGTSGQPKGAVRGRTDPALRAAMLAELNFGAEEVHLATGPLYHAGPHAFAALTHFTGGSVVVTPSFDPAAWVRLVGEHRVTSAFMAPTHLKRIVGLPDQVLAAADLTSLRTVIVNAAPVPFALKQEVIAKLGAGFLYEVYGATELGIVTVLGPSDQLAKPGSCGRPYGEIGIKVVDSDDAELPAGTVGRLFVRTPNAIHGYHDADVAMEELQGDGAWKSVGDMGWLDGEGYLSICDRRTDLVITGGVNVYPAEVEAALYAHPDVADAAVIGVPDDDWGERVHAVVAPRPGCHLDPVGLNAFLATHLAGYKRPRSWEVRASLPRTESGKLLRRVLRAEHGETEVAPA